MSDAAGLLEKLKSDEASGAILDTRQKVLDYPRPNWPGYAATKEHDFVLSKLLPSAGSKSNMVSFTKESVPGCMDAMTINEVAPIQGILYVLCDMVKEDGSCYSIFADALKGGCGVYKPLLGLLGRSSSNADWADAADKGAWLLTAIICHSPKYFSQEDVTGLLNSLLSKSGCSELGVLEAVTNLLKAEDFRGAVWANPAVPSLVFKVEAKTSSSPIMYKSVFAIWMVSFDRELVKSLQGNKVVQKIKSILTLSRTEKVIRLCLTVLKNFLAQKADCQGICEDIVEEGVLECVQQLEYEKWRDAELYDDIRELVQLISTEVKELSNFDRYMKELESGTLSWGFIHSAKFFGENVMKFDTAEFKAVKVLASLLSSDNPTTLAVACHDIGEFVSLHPFGKKQVARLGVKERVMELMGSADADKKEVRREALLCCQKIMLNKWSEIASAEKK